MSIPEGKALMAGFNEQTSERISGRDITRQELQTRYKHAEIELPRTRRVATHDSPRLIISRILHGGINAIVLADESYLNLQWTYLG